VQLPCDLRLYWFANGWQNTIINDEEIVLQAMDHLMADYDCSLAVSD